MRLGYLRDEGITDSRVLAALDAVPRERFVPDGSRAVAYENRPLSIGHRQTISQPYIVAFMTQELGICRGDRVLEVGTGSGYQTAVLAELCDHVFSIEIIESLAARARCTLDDLGYAVRTTVGNGRFGWPEHAPYDAILVTAAADDVPQPLVDQLAPGGRLLIPIGPRFGRQDLVMIRTRGDGTSVSETLIPVRFVPLTGRTQPGVRRP